MSDKLERLNAKLEATRPVWEHIDRILLIVFVVGIAAFVWAMFLLQKGGER